MHAAVRFEGIGEEVREKESYHTEAPRYACPYTDKGKHIEVQCFEAAPRPHEQKAAEVEHYRQRKDKLHPVPRTEGH